MCTPTIAVSLVRIPTTVDQPLTPRSVPYFQSSFSNIYDFWNAKAHLALGIFITLNKYLDTLEMFTKFAEMFTKTTEHFAKILNKGNLLFHDKMDQYYIF